MKSSSDIINKQIKQSISEHYSKYLKNTLKQVDDDPSLSSEQKVTFIVKIADSFVKINKLSQVRDLDDYTPIIVKSTIKKIVVVLKKRLTKKEFEVVVDAIASIDDDFLDVEE